MTGEERAAALAVCDHAKDAADARELLLMLGLVDEQAVARAQRVSDEAAWWQELVAAGYARPVAS